MTPLFMIIQILSCVYIYIICDYGNMSVYCCLTSACLIFACLYVPCFSISHYLQQSHRDIMLLQFHVNIVLF